MKKHSSSLALILMAALLAPALGQTAQPAQQPAATPAPQAAQAAPSPQEDSDEDDVVRITTNLVQFDAVVFDKKGNLITDLRPEDFEVFVDGRKQDITNFSFVSSEPASPAAPAPAAATPADRRAPPMPPAIIKPGQVRRTVALVVDDLGTSFESMASVRQALKKFVEQQMQPGDLVAVMRTSAGMGALQQFTSDKRVLLAAVERVRWSPSGRAGVAAFAPIEAKAIGGAELKVGDGQGGKDEEPRDAEQALDEFRDELFSVGTLGALNFIVRGMSELPGRKSVVMFSDGFSITNRDDPSKTQRVLDNLKRLVDLANRASVVVYTVDARGLPTLGLTAADNTSGRTPQEVLQQMNARGARYFDTQTGLNYLAAETGGMFMRNTNDLGGAVQRVLDDQKGYYLIGFRPDSSFFESDRGRRRYNDIKVKVKRPGVNLRYRSGFLGVPDSEARPVRRTRVEQLVGALTSPFSSGEVRLRLTSLFGGDAKAGSFVTSLMHIDMTNVKFTPEADGWEKAVIDVAALTFGDGGEVVDEINRTETVRARGDTLKDIRERGLVYTMQVPVKRPGAYQLRVAVRDASTEKLGSASQFIEVPNLKKDRLALSGIVMQSSAIAQQPPAEGAQQDKVDPMGTAAVRRFSLGQQIDYFFNIYNARPDPAGKPQLQVQTRLFRDGKLVYAGPPTPFDPGRQTDVKRMQSGTRIRLSPSLGPGEYVMQVVVTDALAPEKHRTATQWIDFEIVK